jgi:putative ABC transport system substrate-binding protein
LAETHRHCGKSGIKDDPSRIHDRQEPSRAGLVASLNQPGGNATGINLLIAETETKRIEILRQLIPGGTRFAVLVNPQNADAAAQLSMVQSAAQTLDQKITIINASTDLQLDEAFASFQHDAIGAFIVVADSFFVNRRDQIILLSNQQRIPGMYFLREFAESGGLASYGVSLVDAYREAEVYAGKILGGTKPNDLPVIQPTKFDLVINVKAAKMLGLTIPTPLLATADEVIE